LRRSSRRLRSTVVGLSTAFAALAIAAPAPAATNITCNLQLVAVIPQPAPTAANVGLTKCDKLGQGAQTDSSVTTRTSALTGSFTGPFEMKFKKGSLLGTFTINFVTTVGGNPLHITGVTYDGTVTVTGGTGAYAGVTGGGTVTGFSPDAVFTNLTENLTLNGV
jgi:hypothetical protein